MMRWLKRYFKKPEEKKRNITNEYFYKTIQQIVPVNNSLADIFNEIETISFGRSSASTRSRPLEARVKWKRLNEVSTFTFNYCLSGDLDDERLINDFCCRLKDAYDGYREILMERFIDKVEDVIKDG